MGVSQIEVQNQGPKWGSQMGVPNGGPKYGSQMGVPNGGPKWGSQMGVPNGGLNQGPLSGSHITLCLEMSKCQNVKMAKWQNGKTPIAQWFDPRQ
jgi:hypothetical protein